MGAPEVRCRWSSCAESGGRRDLSRNDAIQVTLEGGDRASLAVGVKGPLLRYSDTSADTLALQIGPDLYIGASGEADDA